MNVWEKDPNSKIEFFWSPIAVTYTLLVLLKWLRLQVSIYFSRTSPDGLYGREDTPATLTRAKTPALALTFTSQTSARPHPNTHMYTAISSYFHSLPHTDRTIVTSTQTYTFITARTRRNTNKHNHNHPHEFTYNPSSTKTCTDDHTHNDM